MPADPLLISDVCRRLGLPYARLFNAVVSGKVPATRPTPGGRWRIDAKDIPTIAAALHVEAPPEKLAS